MKASISVAVVDHHPLMLGAILRLLIDTDGFKMVGTGTTLTSVGEICRQARPDIIIFEPSLPGDAYAAIGDAIKISPLTRTVAFTGAVGVETTIRALDAGVSAYVLKQSQVQN
jgi:DNA-binding NarL/FixJ family response regulator